MRSARMLLTTAAASAVFVIGAPGAYAAASGDWDHDDSSYSKEHDNGSKHDEPRGGMHTGGGALAAVSEGDWDHEDASSGKEHDKGSKHEDGGKHDEPRGGMHTGGGALAAVNEGDWDGGGRESKEGGSQTYRQDEGEGSPGRRRAREAARWHAHRRWWPGHADHDRRRAGRPGRRRDRPVRRPTQEVGQRGGVSRAGRDSSRAATQEPRGGPARSPPIVSAPAAVPQ
ncbi:hypothetical protein RKD42_000955 [Streptomyces ambofaciens]